MVCQVFEPNLFPALFTLTLNSSKTRPSRWDQKKLQSTLGRGRKGKVGALNKSTSAIRDGNDTETDTAGTDTSPFSQIAMFILGIASCCAPSGTNCACRVYSARPYISFLAYQLSNPQTDQASTLPPCSLRHPPKMPSHKL